MNELEKEILQLINERYPFNFINIKSITNEMYQCHAQQGTYFIRITNYKTYEEQLEEVTYTNFLYQNGLAVPPIIHSLNGNLVERLTLDKEIFTVLYKTAPGIHLPRCEWNSNMFKKLGKQIGKLHRISKSFEQTNLVKHINDWYENEEYNFLKYIPKEETTIREIASDVLTSIKELQKSTSNYGLIHGDLWLENILVENNSNLTMIDFQDCEKHFYIFDLAVPIYSAIEYSFAGNGNIVDYEHSITKAIFAGYQEENELPKEMIDKFPMFIKLKEIFEYSLLHMYWDKEELTEEQVRIMNLYRMKIENKYTYVHV
ncbi:MULTISPECIES: phosphotransferase enzyme family protein [Bacillus cereus group]|uniref:Protein kinase n=1 Tax=Bacillus wiedmannii TaxID=1890302 RepID=A0ABD6TJ37_9BACI|nr:MULTISPECIES: phosphotransferase [Bacillus cereus group]KAA0783333.1 protein kinase [Bacillus sp. BB081]PEO53558.1 protein kinase [Bacillus wiedmannii]PEO65432.1 protein kinase [Bacillus wiedmannii]PEP71205.1 protein kinase [Bacillus wiedmannii]PGB94007.1 protein kinase [Bacillus wiedmannii]